jgi:hypothetical protein
MESGLINEVRSKFWPLIPVFAMMNASGYSSSFVTRLLQGSGVKSVIWHALPPVAPQNVVVLQALSA